MQKPAISSLLALAVFMISFGGWWRHNNSAEAQSYATKAAIDSTADSYAEDVEGAECATGCRGQEAGWSWARGRHIAASMQCPPGLGLSFRDGCRAYADTFNSVHDDALTDVTD
jgi:hypothetical protein